jgi:hypothetical protein
MSSRSSRCASTSLRCLSIDSELPLSCEAGQLQWQSKSRRACARILLTRSTLSMTKARPPIGSMAFRSVVRRRSKVGELDAVAVQFVLTFVVRDSTGSVLETVVQEAVQSHTARRPCWHRNGGLQRAKTLSGGPQNTAKSSRMVACVDLCRPRVEGVTRGSSQSRNGAKTKQAGHYPPTRRGMPWIGPSMAPQPMLTGLG